MFIGLLLRVIVMDRYSIAVALVMIEIHTAYTLGPPTLKISILCKEVIFPFLTLLLYIIF